MGKESPTDLKKKKKIMTQRSVEVWVEMKTEHQI